MTWSMCRASLARSFLKIRPTSVPRVAYASTSASPSEDTPAPAPAPARPAQPTKKFVAYRDTISEATLKAITERPYQYVSTSDVQEKVLDLLPGLARAYDSGIPNARDLLVRARTGTGKTLAFLVPILEARARELQEVARQALVNAGRDPAEDDSSITGPAVRQYAKNNVGALIISPTRELATQIANEALKLSYHHRNFEVQLLCGGNNRSKQVHAWAKGSLDIVVATPGRFLDLLRSDRELADQLRSTKTFVLDEADTLLEMGFRDDLEAIVAAIPPKPKRQTLLFSATVSAPIRQITHSFLADNHVYIDCVGDTLPTHMTIPQYATTLPSANYQIPHLVKTIIHDQLIHRGTSKVIVFLPTTKQTQLFASFIRNLHRDNLPAGRSTEVYEIHSKLTQMARTYASDRFRKATGPAILVTSDVSARGVDYPRVTRVIQVGIPGSRDQYIHRVGRTGRGSSLSSGRGDLILLPFEVGFLTWQLTDIPLKSVTIKQLDEQLAELASKFDSEPRNADLKYTHPVTPIIETVGPSVANLVSRIDPEAVRVTFLSQLGYYIAKSPELRVARNVILEGLNAWTVEACGLDQPPHVSPAFLSEMGFSDGRTKHWNRSKSFQPERRASPWSGRGTQSRRDLPKVNFSPSSERRDPSEERFDVDEFRSQRYDRGGSRGSYGGGSRGGEYGDARRGSGGNNFKKSYGDRGSSSSGYRTPSSYGDRGSPSSRSRNDYQY